MKKGHWILVAAGWLSLISAAILWYAVFRDGVTLRGAATAALFTVLGVFWLVLHSRGAAQAPDAASPPEPGDTAGP